jgi:formate C-acetyltransferase
MNERLKKIRQQTMDREYRKYRMATLPDIEAECKAKNLSPMQRVAWSFKRLCELEMPVIEAGEKIVFTRTTPRYKFSNLGNICADWGMLLSQGLLARRAVAVASKERLAGNATAAEFLDAAILTSDAVLDLASRYAAQARKQGRDDIAAILEQVPAKPARTFHEALQSLRFCHSMNWLEGHPHMGLGRFDQYLWPYLQADLAAGRETRESAKELITEFFLMLNRDTDLYPGVQQGDNGQSLMLGGVKRDGTDAVNELTKMVLEVSLDVNMIDPKINLRINKNTDLDLLMLATRLTRLGLGFPQYENDDVVIPALAKHGYDLEDARDYTVAACWEFIIPGKGMEIPNINALSFPYAADKGIREGLAAGDDFDGILERTAKNIREQVNTYVNNWRNCKLDPAPFYSVLIDDALEQGKDLSVGAKYNNFGIHGACSSNAADALAAVKKFVFEEKSVDRGELVNALITNYEGHEPLRKKLAEEGPKVGNNDDETDAILVKLFDYFADACEAIKDNGRGGIVRPGTGTAMYYVWLARNNNCPEPVVGATADGRHKGDFFSSSLAPSPGTRIRGPFSVLQTYSKINYQRICNGGPITMELSDTVFRDDESIRKVAMLVRTFVDLGCQQFQLNTLNVATLRDAKIHPEKHRNLIVRVWGWSGYFCELAEEYQDHIIQRNVYSMA